MNSARAHCDAQGFVARELPEPSLPPSSGSRGAADTTKNKGHTCGQTAWVLWSWWLWSVVVVVVVVGEVVVKLW